MDLAMRPPKFNSLRASDRRSVIQIFITGIIGGDTTYTQCRLSACGLREDGYEFMYENI